MMQLKDVPKIAGGSLRGAIYGDTRDRFNDGEYVITSRVVEILPDNVYRTLYSTYKVEFAKEPVKATWIADSKGALSLEASAA